MSYSLMPENCCQITAGGPDPVAGNPAATFLGY